MVTGTKVKLLNTKEKEIRKTCDCDFRYVQERKRFEGTELETDGATSLRKFQQKRG
jgi:hypothetical protein